VIATRAENANLAEFGIQTGPVPFSLGEPVLKVVERFSRLGGTEIPSAVNCFYAGHDRGRDRHRPAGPAGLGAI
jgi:hypothetical protein